MRLEDYWGSARRRASGSRSRSGPSGRSRRSRRPTSGRSSTPGSTAGEPPGSSAARTARPAWVSSRLATHARVYDDLLTVAAGHALTDHAADRIRVLTPLTERSAIESRLDEVVAARDAWAALDDGERDRVVAAFDDYDAAEGSDLAAVETAVALRDVGSHGDALRGYRGAGWRQPARRRRRPRRRAGVRSTRRASTATARSRSRAVRTTSLT